MVLHGVCDLAQEDSPLRLEDMRIPQTGVGEVRIRVSACGVCHAELDEIEGRTPPPSVRSISSTTSNTPTAPSWPSSAAALAALEALRVG